MRYSEETFGAFRWMANLVGECQLGTGSAPKAAVLMGIPDLEAEFGMCIHDLPSKF